MIAVVTPGAVGGLLAALLDRAGIDVTLVARESSAARLRDEGLEVRSAMHGVLRSHPPVTTAPPPGSAVLLAVKAGALPDVVPMLEAAQPGEVLTLLNGLDHVPALRSRPGITRVAGASISVEAVREAGHIEHRSDFLVVTVPHDAAQWRTTTALRAAGIDLRTGRSEAEVLWTKLRVLAPLALLTSYWQAPLGEARERDPQLTEQLLAEVAALAGASGLPTDVDRLSASLHGVRASMRSSLQHDLDAGQPSELEHIGGTLLHVAAGLPEGDAARRAPTLKRVVTALRQRETSR